MIEFSVKDKIITVRAHCKTPLPEYSVDLKFKCPGNSWARLLCDNLRNAYYDAVRAAREEEYKKGRADERAHRAKRTWFYRKLEVPDYGF